MPIWPTLSGQQIALQYVCDCKKLGHPLCVCVCELAGKRAGVNNEQQQQPILTIDSYVILRYLAFLLLLMFYDIQIWLLLINLKVV